ncbi:hypothetical protein [Jiangella asiatica]|uniref:Uncharacterized protein n=1 Tax=Jiangella asiatica TaxID=2530372 RepID=A0A4R5D4C2_9ACTN|nr:hypothetical protein [Jiangella asiatica]TDE08249.1 hypothetical protein E1269_18250 [Jiangella asiatica]
MALQRHTGDGPDTGATFDPDEAARAERGAHALVALPAEPSDDPQVRAVLGEIPGRLGVSFVSPIFTALAHWGEFLIGAWRAYAPLMETDGYRAALDQITVPQSLLPAADAGLAGQTDDLDALREHLWGQQRLLPQLLLLASAWYQSADGVDQSRPGPPVPASRGSVAPAPAAAGAGDAALESVYRRVTELHGHPRVLSVYRGLGRWPEFLLGAAPVLYDRILSPAYRPAKTALAGRAMAAAETLGMPASTAVQTEGPAQILALFRTRLIPTLVLDTAVLLALVDPTFPDTQGGNG